MRSDRKFTILVAVIEAVLAFIVGWALFLLQEARYEKDTVETLTAIFEGIESGMSYEEAMEFLSEEALRNDELTEDLSQKEQETNNLNEQIESKDKKIEEQKKVITERDSEIAALKEQINSAEIIDNTIESAKNYADSGKYELALTVLRSVTERTPMMDAMISDYEEEYEAHILTQVDSMMYEENFDDAIALLNEALKVIPDNQILAQKLVDVQNSKPQSFMSILTPYEKDSYTEIVSGNFMEMGGEQYRNGFILGRYDGYAVFNLKGQYTRISGVVGHIDGSYRHNTTIYVYADDELIETIYVDWEDLPKEFSIDVAGVKKLKFQKANDRSETGFAELIIK